MLTDTRVQPRSPVFELIAVLFYLLSLGGIGALVWVTTNTPAIPFGTGTAGDIVWAFVNTIGVLRPLLVLFGSVLLFRLGLRLRTGHISAARWAKLVFNWIFVISIGAILQALFVSSAGVDVDWNEALSRSGPWLGLLVFGFFGRFFLMSNWARFGGDEDITSKNTRNAWNLLMPTIITLIVIAIRPLEQVFVTSLTNERFASSQSVEFVGFDNYTQLLSVRLDLLECETDPETAACATQINRDGVEEVVYPRARDVLEPAYREQRYRDFNSFDIFGQHFILSARDPDFIESFWTSVVYTVFAIALQLVLGLLMASVLASKMRGLTLLRLAMLVPLAIPTLIATQFWDVMLAPNDTGIINQVLLGLNLIEQPQTWLLDPALQIPSVVLVIVWKETPTMALFLLPGLLAISKEVYQAASIDGANTIQRFFLITLPMMRPTIGVALVLRTMVTLRVFDVFEILLGRTRFSMATYGYEALTQRFQLGYSSAISVTIFLIILFFTVIYMRTLRIDEA